MYIEKIQENLKSDAQGQLANFSALWILQVLTSRMFSNSPTVSAENTPTPILNDERTPIVVIKEPRAW